MQCTFKIVILAINYTDLQHSQPILIFSPFAYLIVQCFIESLVYKISEKKYETQSCSFYCHKDDLKKQQKISFKNL